MLSRCLLFVFIAGALSAPVDEPIRVDLPVYEASQQSGAHLSEPFVPENHPEFRINKESIVDNFLSNKNTATLTQSNPPIGSVNYGGGLLSAPVTTLEGALLETEGFGSKTLSVNENVQNLAAGIFQPKPIVDTIKEEEKYGNNGDKFYSAGRAIVNGAENVSNFVNTVLEVPVKVFRNLTRKATEKLNHLGGRLVGL
ncbi:PREDICTED: uncharacterized protein LOC106102884 [Papilio polytes]|uniref:uncharacterized protein LOC106102884 n=1 Tax=Papilio polytes TaxID=76194 RepID=UPI0006768869|nr:PREDICTED: uncharacterized protein LOC106102884 [Papilio polytes]XP_013137950.1 PREDICTED: uncharacterized protein LOC106102884 [Papilio polytes]XP_013137960.1 PREDICTED: uncharacterized protein LOC106102884 [Papilio polytes]